MTIVKKKTRQRGGFTPASESRACKCGNEWYKTAKRKLPRAYRKRGCKPMAWGFTLAEMLVVMGITAVISGFLLYYNSVGRRQIDLSVEEIKLVQIILKSKSFAISTYSSVRGELALCGYGVHLNYAGNYYSLFSYKEADCGGSFSIDTNNGDKYRELEKYVLASGIKFSGVANAIGDLLFLPPEPKLVVWPTRGGSAPPQSGIIRLATVDNASTVEIRINQAGQISY